MAWEVHNLSDLFNEDEKIDFLERRDFTVIDFDVWNSRNEYHNKASFHDTTIKIAYKDEIPQDLVERNEEHNVSSKIGIDVVFNREMKKKMLLE